MPTRHYHFCCQSNFVSCEAKVAKQDSLFVFMIMSKVTCNFTEISIIVSKLNFSGVSVETEKP